MDISRLVRKSETKWHIEPFGEIRESTRNHFPHCLYVLGHDLLQLRYSGLFRAGYFKRATSIGRDLTMLAAVGKFIVMAAMTIFLPIYALLLASIFLIGFIVLASIVVPIGQSLLDKHEPVIEVHDDEKHPEAA